MRNEPILFPLPSLRALRGMLRIPRRAWQSQHNESRDRHVVPNDKSSGLLAMTMLVWMKNNPKITNEPISHLSRHCEEDRILIRDDAAIYAYQIEEACRKGINVCKRNHLVGESVP